MDDQFSDAQRSDRNADNPRGEPPAFVFPDAYGQSVG